MNALSNFRISTVSVYASLTILVLAPVTYSQVPASSSPETLAEAGFASSYILEALQENKGILAQEKRYLAARESITSARAFPNPRIQLTHFVESIQTRTGPQRQAIQLQQPLPAMGAISRRADAARAHSEALWYAYVGQQFELVDQVIDAALEGAFLDKAIEITKLNVALLKRFETIAADRVKSGGRLDELLRLQVEIERQSDSIERQETKRSAFGYRLESLLGREPEGALLTLDWAAPAPLQSDPKQWLLHIQERSPQLAMLQSIESSQEARERLARLANRPELSVGINYLRTGDALNAATPGSGQDPWALMVGVSLPIWGKANNAIALSASLETDAVSAQISDLERTLAAEGLSWIVKLEDSEKRILRYETKLLPLARQAQEITESSYQSGKSSALDVIESDRALLALQTEYWRAAADAWLARWKLATLSGGLWLN